VSQRPLTVRSATAEEAETIAKLVNDAYGRTQTPSGWTSEDDILAGPRIEPDRVRELVDTKDSRLFVARKDEDVIGCVRLQRSSPGEVELGLLSVRTDLQGEDVGKQLLAAAEERAIAELDAERIVLKVITEREELLDWHERRGYERTGETTAFDPEPPQRSLVGELAFERLVKDLG